MNKVRVDVTNPGQFFACCGLLELSHRLFPNKGVCGWFDDNYFHLSATDNDVDILSAVIDGLRKATLADDESRGTEYTHPVILKNSSFGDLVLDWWLGDSDDKSPFKVWAGRQKPLVIMQDMQKGLSNATNDLFSKAIPLSGRFGFDPRSSWKALDIGFSPNEHVGMKVSTFYAVELLAAFGLQGFRPAKCKKRWMYCTWRAPTPTVAARVTCTGSILGVIMHRYRFSITMRNKQYGSFDFAIRIGDDE